MPFFRSTTIKNRTDASVLSFCPTILEPTSLTYISVELCVHLPHHNVYNKNDQNIKHFSPKYWKLKLFGHLYGLNFPKLFVIWATIG